MKCWYTIPNLQIGQALSSDFRLPKVEQGLTIFPDITPINPQWFDYMQEVWGLTYWHSIVFARTANQRDTAAHIDLDLIDKSQTLNAIVINWCLGGQGSTMHWYEQPEHPSELITFDNQTDTIPVRYRGWPCEELKEIDRAEITNQATLTRVDIPHSVTTGARSRYSISMRFYPHHNNWQELVLDWQQRGWICGS